MFATRRIVLNCPQSVTQLKALRKDFDRFLARLPQEHEPVGYFLKRTYTREVFLADHLRPDR